MSLYLGCEPTTLDVSEMRRCFQFEGRRVAVKVQSIPDIHNPEEEWAGEIYDNLVSELSVMRACTAEATCVDLLGAGRVDNEVSSTDSSL